MCLLLPRALSSVLSHSRNLSRLMCEFSLSPSLRACMVDIFLEIFRANLVVSTFLFFFLCLLVLFLYFVGDVLFELVEECNE